MNGVGGLLAPLVGLLLAAAVWLAWPTGGAGPGAGLRGAWAALRARVRRGRAADEEADALIEVVEALDAALAAGATPLDALTSVAHVRAALAGEGPRALGAGGATVDLAVPLLIAHARAGDGLAAGWADVAARLRSPQLDLLARAWALSETSGASLAAAARTSVHLLRRARDERRRTEAAVAGARATMTVLTALPLAGPLLAAFVGLDPGRVYLGSPATALMLGGGVLLVLVGRWWVDRLVAAALRGPGLS